jgi:hypothetical protein
MHISQSAKSSDPQSHNLSNIYTAYLQQVEIYQDVELKLLSFFQPSKQGRSETFGNLKWVSLPVSATGDSGDWFTLH